MLTILFSRKPNFKFVKGDIKSPDLLHYVIKQEDAGIVTANGIYKCCAPMCSYVLCAPRCKDMMYRLYRYV